MRIYIAAYGPGCQLDPQFHEHGVLFVVSGSGRLSTNSSGKMTPTMALTRNCGRYLSSYRFRVRLQVTKISDLLESTNGRRTELATGAFTLLNLTSIVPC
jgi:hypothetical protein